MKVCNSTFTIRGSFLIMCIRLDRSKQCRILFYLCKYYLFSNKVCKMIYLISVIIDNERYANTKQSVETPNWRSFWISDSCDR